MGSILKELRDTKIVIVTGDDELKRRIQVIMQAAEESKIKVTVLHTNTKAHENFFGVGLDKIFFDEMNQTQLVADIPAKYSSPKRKALMAQLERAKLQRNKNLVRDFTRQLESTW